jgi:hypothetical protein
MRLFQAIALPAWAEGFKAVTSTCESCHRSVTLGHLSAQKAGIKMRGRWYCSSSCFTSAAELRLTELMMPEPEQASHVSRMPLGLIFVSRGLLTSAQLREAVDEQKESGEEIGEILMRRGLVSETQVTAVRAGQWGCPVFAVPLHAMQAEVQIPEALIDFHSAIPLHYVTATKRLLVGFVKGVEYGLLYAIEQMTGCKTQPCFITPGDFQSQIALRQLALEPSGNAKPREITFESVQTPGEMARILCSYVVEFEADEAIICRYREHFWTRLKCGLRDVDLLFQAE